MIHNDASTLESEQEEQRKQNEALIQKKEALTRHAKKAINDFLSELGISKIIYVDDRCSIQELKETFVGQTRALKEVKPQELDYIDWNLPDAVFNTKIIELWDAGNDEAKRQLFTKLLIYTDNKDDIDNSIAPLTLKKHLESKIELLSPTQWLEKKDAAIQFLKDGHKVLFLFDIEFKYAPLADGRDGKALAAELLSYPGIKKNIFCGIFSHLFTLEEENDKRNEFCKLNQFNKRNFYTISKKRFNEGEYLPGLAEGIRNTLLINEVESLKQKSSRIISTAFKDALIDIGNLTPESFNHIIQKSSNYEGAWEMSTLLRINNIITVDKALNRLLAPKSRVAINIDLAKIRKIEKIKTGGETPTDISQVRDLREKEIFVKGEVLNKLHFPISNGDIFKINSKHYILLSQPCNLALRSKGKRVRDYDNGFLIELNGVSIEDYSKYVREDLSTCEVIEQSDISANDLTIANLAKFTTVSLIPLDLTVFNEDGSSTINLNMQEHTSKTIQESWKLRYKKIYIELLEYKKTISIYRNLRSSHKVSLKNHIYNGSIFKNYDLDNEAALNGRKLSFDIKRVSHYKAPYSSDLLQKFMQYLSRNAFDHDFLNKV